MADGEKAATEYTIGWGPQTGPQAALLACPVFDLFLGGARADPRTAIIALPRDGACFQPLSALSMAAKI
jgi:hypothetical protein